MSDTLRQQVALPSSSIHEPVFPFNHSSSSLQCSVSNQSSFSVQAMPHHSFFASASIGSISNCVFTVHPRDPAGSTEENVAKRPRLDGSSKKNFSVVLPSHFDMRCRKHRLFVFSLQVNKYFECCKFLTFPSSFRRIILSSSVYKRLFRRLFSCKSSCCSCELNL